VIDRRGFVILVVAVVSS
jgi:hypothetical protein